MVIFINGVALVYIMGNEIKLLLSEYGLKDKDIEVFLKLVDKNRLTAYQIAKETRIHRSTVYSILDRLLKLNFVYALEKDGTKYYSLNDFSGLLSKQKEKEILLEKIISKIDLKEESGPDVKIFEGIDGQKQFNYGVFMAMKNRKIRFCYIIGNTRSQSLSLGQQIETMVKEFKRNRIKLDYKGIWNKRLRNDFLDLFKGLGENRFLEVSSDTTTMIYDNHVAFLITTDKPVTVVIKNKKISDEMKNYFEHMWKVSKD